MSKPDPHPLIEPFLDALWLERGLSDNTVSSYRSDLEKFSLWLDEQGVGAVGHDHTRAIEALVTAWHGQRGCSLPGGATVVRTSGRLLVSGAVPRG